MVLPESVSSVKVPARDGRRSRARQGGADVVFDLHARRKHGAQYDKKALVAEVAAVAQTAQSVVAAEYRGLTVAQMTELRAKARASASTCEVVKNTLARARDRRHSSSSASARSSRAR